MMSKKAFTLIELLIVIAIMVLMVAFAVPQFQKYGKRSALSSKAEEFKLLIENAYQYSKNPELGYKGMVITLNFINGTNTTSHYADFMNLSAPWTGANKVKSWQEVAVPSDMVLENEIGSEIKKELYFIPPGIYLKESAGQGVAFKLRYKSLTNSDYVDIKVLPLNTTNTTSQNFKVEVYESWEQ